MATVKDDKKVIADIDDYVARRFGTPDKYTSSNPIDDYVARRFAGVKPEGQQEAPEYDGGVTGGLKRFLSGILGGGEFLAKGIGAEMKGSADETDKKVNYAINSVAKLLGYEGEPIQQSIVGDITDRINGKAIDYIGDLFKAANESRFIQSGFDPDRKWNNERFTSIVSDPAKAFDYFTDTSGLLYDLPQGFGNAVDFMALARLAPKGQIAKTVAGATGRASGLFGDIGASRLAQAADSNLMKQFLQAGAEYGTTMAPAQVLMNGGMIVDELRSQGKSDSEIKDTLHSLYGEEAPVDLLFAILTGNIVKGTPARMLGRNASTPARAAANLGAGLPLEGVGGYYSNVNQAILADKYSGKPYGTWDNPTESEDKAGWLGAVTAVPFSVAGAYTGARDGKAYDEAEAARKAPYKALGELLGGENGLYRQFRQDVEQYQEDSARLASRYANAEAERDGYYGEGGAGEGKTWVRNSTASLDGAQPQLLDAIDSLAKKFYEDNGVQLVVTSATDGSHAGGEHSHEKGWKVDIADAGANGVDATGDGAFFTADYQPTPYLYKFLEYGRSLGLGMNVEDLGKPNVHIDVALDGHQWADDNGNRLAEPKNYGGFNPRKGGQPQAEQGNSADPNFTEKQNEIWQAAQYASQRAKEKFGFDIPPELIYKQWAHESGENFDSKNARYNNNYGGLTQVEPNGEENRQPDGGNYYRKYNNLQEFADSYVDDFIKFYPEINGVKNEREFAEVLKRYGYYGDTVENYTADMEGVKTPKRGQSVQNRADELYAERMKHVPQWKEYLENQTRQQQEQESATTPEPVKPRLVSFLPDDDSDETKSVYDSFAKDRMDKALFNEDVDSAMFLRDMFKGDEFQNTPDNRAKLAERYSDDFTQFVQSIPQQTVQPIQPAPVQNAQQQQPQQQQQPKAGSKLLRNDPVIQAGRQYLDELNNSTEKSDKVKALQLQTAISQGDAAGVESILKANNRPTTVQQQQQPQPVPQPQQDPVQQNTTPENKLQEQQQQQQQPAQETPKKQPKTPEETVINRLQTSVKTGASVKTKKLKGNAILTLADANGIEIPEADRKSLSSRNPKTKTINEWRDHLIAQGIISLQDTTQGTKGQQRQQPPQPAPQETAPTLEERANNIIANATQKARENWQDLQQNGTPTARKQRMATNLINSLSTQEEGVAQGTSDIINAEDKFSNVQDLKGEVRTAKNADIYRRASARPSAKRFEQRREAANDVDEMRDIVTIPAWRGRTREDNISLRRQANEFPKSLVNKTRQKRATSLVNDNLQAQEEGAVHGGNEAFSGEDELQNVRQRYNADVAKAQREQETQVARQQVQQALTDLQRQLPTQEEGTRQGGQNAINVEDELPNVQQEFTQAQARSDRNEAFRSAQEQYNRQQVDNYANDDSGATQSGSAPSKAETGYSGEDEFPNISKIIAETKSQPAQQSRQPAQKPITEPTQVTQEPQQPAQEPAQGKENVATVEQPAKKKTRGKRASKNQTPNDLPLFTEKDESQLGENAQPFKDSWRDWLSSKAKPFGKEIDNIANTARHIAKWAQAGVLNAKEALQTFNDFLNSPTEWIQQFGRHKHNAYQALAAHAWHNGLDFNIPDSAFVGRPVAGKSSNGYRTTSVAVMVPDKSPQVASSLDELAWVVRNPNFVGATVEEIPTGYRVVFENEIDSYGKGSSYILNEAEDSANEFIEAVKYAAERPKRGEPKKSLEGNADTRITNLVADKDLTPRQKLLKDFAKKLGVTVQYFDNPDGRFHGAFADGVTFLNVNSKKGLGEVFWHETLHWLKSNNPELYKQLVKAADITDTDRQAFLERTKRTDLHTDEAIDEEILADQMDDVAKRTGLMQSIAGKNRGVVQRVMQWLKDTLNSFIETFRNPTGGLKTAQAKALAAEFGRLADQIKDANGNQMFSYNRRTGDIEVVGGRETPAMTREQIESAARSDNVKYSINPSNNSNESWGKRAANWVRGVFGGKKPTKAHQQVIVDALSALAKHKIYFGYNGKQDADYVVDSFQKAIFARHGYDFATLLPVVGKQIAKNLKLADTDAMSNYIADWMMTGAVNNTSPEAKEFEKAMNANPGEAELLRSVRNSFDALSRMTPEERFDNSIVQAEKPKKKRGGFMEEWVDDLNPIKALEDKLVAKSEDPAIAKLIKEKLAPYLHARIGKGKGALTDMMIGAKGMSAQEIQDTRDVLQAQFTNVDFSEWNPLQAIVDHAEGDMKGLERYALAKLEKEMYEKMREVDKNGNPKHTGLVPSHSEADCNAVINAGEKKFGKAQEELVQYANTLAAIQYTSGLITATQFYNMVGGWENYIPTARVFDEDEPYSIDIKAADSSKQKKGSYRRIVDPLQKLAANTEIFMRQAINNDAKLRVVAMARCGDFGEVFAEAPKGDQRGHTIHFREDGKIKYLVTSDESIVRALESIQTPADSNVVVQALKTMGLVMRGMYTMFNTEFMAGNVFRDMPDSYIHNKYGSWNPLVAVPMMVKTAVDGFAQSMGIRTQDKAFKEFRAHGGTQSGFSFEITGDSSSAVEDMAGNMPNWKKVWRKFIQAAEASENMTRYATYQTALDGLTKEHGGRATEHDKDLAALQARSATVDFARAGRSMRSVNKYLLFSNAAMQSLSLWGEAIADVAQKKKGAWGNLGGKVFKTIMGAVVPAMLLSAFNYSDDDRRKRYGQLHSWEKDNYWVLPVDVGGYSFRIPKGMDIMLRFTSALTEELVSYLAEDKPAEWKRLQTVLRNGLPSLTTTVFTPLVETWVNYSVFKDAPIVPYGEQDDPKYKQYGKTTTAFAKWLGKAINESPRQIDHLISGYLGSQFSYVASGFEGVPLVLRRFMFDPDKNPRVVQDYYEKLREQNELLNEYKARRQDGEKVDLPEDYDRALHARLKAIQEPMRKISSMEKKITESDKLDDDQKKEKLRKLEERRVALCERAFKKAR